MKANCKLCDKETEFDDDLPKELRDKTYVEGVGQLCPDCYKKTSGHKQQLVSVPRTFTCPHCQAINTGEGENAVITCKNCSHLFTIP